MSSLQMDKPWLAYPETVVVTQGYIDTLKKEREFERKVTDVIRMERDEKQKEINRLRTDLGVARNADAASAAEARRLKKDAEALKEEIGTLKDLLKQMAWHAKKVTGYTNEPTPLDGKETVTHCLKLGTRPNLNIEVKKCSGVDRFDVKVWDTADPDKAVKDKLKTVGYGTWTLDDLRKAGLDIVEKGA